MWEHRSSAGSETWSGGDVTQLTKFNIAEMGEAFQARIALADRPFVDRLGHEGADEAGDGGVVGKDADDLGAASLAWSSRCSALDEEIFVQGALQKSTPARDCRECRAASMR